VPDNLGMLFRRELVMFGPREVLLTSEEPVVKQFLNGRKEGPIGMSEEKDAGQVAAELAALKDEGPPAPGTGPKGVSGMGVPPQIQPSPGLPDRKAAQRRRQRVLDMLHTLPEAAQKAIKDLMEQEDKQAGESRDQSESSGSDHDGSDQDGSDRDGSDRDGGKADGRADGNRERQHRPSPTPAGQR
jgi:phospholipid/cholesterol/gamma-HCH transport system ATP-binding protein